MRPPRAIAPRVPLQAGLRPRGAGRSASNAFMAGFLRCSLFVQCSVRFPKPEPGTGAKRYSLFVAPVRGFATIDRTCFALSGQGSGFTTYSVPGAWNADE